MTEAHHLMVVAPDSGATPCIITGESVTLGRSSENHIQVEFQEVSLKHCTLLRTPSGYAIADENSTNGTQVNGIPVRTEAVDLKDGDVVTLGQSIHARYSTTGGEVILTVSDSVNTIEPEHETKPVDISGLWKHANVCSLPRTTESEPLSLSFIIPLMNEKGTLEELYEAIHGKAKSLTENWEVIFIDDGSTDGSWDLIRRIAEYDPGHVTALRFRSNQGKAAGLAAGYIEASGKYVFTLDADLQDDPEEIPRFIEKMDEGYDIVTGWKQKRHDPWHKVFPSRIFNFMLSRVNGVKLHDHNCGFKCYRREVVKELPMYGEMHRMVPSLASIKGYRTAEIPVTHHPRTYGVSKYGVKRFLRGFMDMWSVYFIKNYRQRPHHLLGGAAFPVAALGFGSLVLGLVYPSFLAMGITICAGLGGVAILLFALGLHASLLVHHHESRDESLPVVERIERKPIVPIHHPPVEKQAPAGQIVLS